MTRGRHRRQQRGTGIGTHGYAVTAVPGSDPSGRALRRTAVAALLTGLALGVPTLGAFGTASVAYAQEGNGGDQAGMGSQNGSAGGGVSGDSCGCGAGGGGNAAPGASGGDQTGPAGGGGDSGTQVAQVGPVAPVPAPNNPGGKQQDNGKGPNKDAFDKAVEDAKDKLGPKAEVQEAPPVTVIAAFASVPVTSGPDQAVDGVGGDAAGEGNQQASAPVAEVESSALEAHRRALEAQAVRDSYAKVLGRAPDPEGQAYYQERLRTGEITQAQLEQQLSASPEAQARR